MNVRVVQSLVVLALCASLTSVAEAGRSSKPKVKYCWEVTIDFECDDDWCGSLEYCDGSVTLLDHRGRKVASGTGKVKDCGPALKTITCCWSYNKCEAVTCDGSILCDGELLKATGCYSETTKDRRGRSTTTKQSCVICGSRCCEDSSGGKGKGGGLIDKILDIIF